MILFLFTSVSTAQIEFGATGGINFAKIYDANLIASPKTLPGPIAGAYLEVNIPLMIAVQTEALYSVKGYVLDYPAGKTTTTYSYLEIPVLLKYSLPIPFLRPSVYAGPEAGFLLSSERKQEQRGLPMEETDTGGETTKTDWGVILGGSLQIAAVSVNVYYDVGLTTVDVTRRESAYNRVWSVMLDIPLF